MEIIDVIWRLIFVDLVNLTGVIASDLHQWCWSTGQGVRSLKKASYQAVCTHKGQRPCIAEQLKIFYFKETWNAFLATASPILTDHKIPVLPASAFYHVIQIQGPVVLLASWATAAGQHWAKTNANFKFSREWQSPAKQKLPIVSVQKSVRLPLLVYYLEKQESYDSLFSVTVPWQALQPESRSR